MSSDRQDSIETAGAASDLVATLIRKAGRRTEPPPKMHEQALAAATAAWQMKVRRRRQRYFALALAASLLIASVSALLFQQFSPLSAAVVAHADRIIGTAEMKRTVDGQWQTLRREDEVLVVGAALRTRAGSLVGLRLGSDISVRIADSTQLVVESASRLRLLQGKIYIDTGSQDHAQHIEVVTHGNVARDLGTQFEVMYRNAAYRLRVRDGQVQLSRGTLQLAGHEGDQLSIDAAGRIEQARIPAHDSDWRWVEQLAPAPQIEGQPLVILLKWVEQETGRAIKFESPAVERRAAAAILHGNVRHLAPLDALAVMLATTDLEYALVDDSILIRLRGNSPQLL